MVAYSYLFRDLLNFSSVLSSAVISRMDLLLAAARQEVNGQKAPQIPVPKATPPKPVVAKKEGSASKVSPTWLSSQTFVIISVGEAQFLILAVLCTRYANVAAVHLRQVPGSAECVRASHICKLAYAHG